MPIIERSKGACIAGLAVSLGCAFFGVGGAAAGDGKYARHVREARIEARLVGAALAHRTPEQLVLAITPKTKTHHTPASAAASTPAPAPASAPAAAAPTTGTTLTDTAAQPATTPGATTTTPATTSTTLTDTTPQPVATIPATPGATTGVTSNLGAGTAGSTGTGTTGPGTDGTGSSDTAGNGSVATLGDGTTTTATTTTPATTTATTTTPATTTPATTTPADTTGTDTTGTDNSGSGEHGRPRSDGTPTNIPSTTTGNGRPAVTGATGSGSTITDCHGRCTGSSQGGTVVPASLPSSNSQGGSFPPLNVTPGAVTPPAPLPTAPVTAASTGSLPLVPPATTPPPATSGSPTSSGNPITRLKPFPTFSSTSTHLNHVGAGNKSRTKSLGTAGSGGVTAAAVSSTRPAASTAATTAVASAPTTGATTPKRAAAPTHKAAKQQSSGTSVVFEPIYRVAHEIVKVIPTAVWIALAAAFGLALAFAGIALRAGRRAHRREREFRAISAAAATDALTGILNRRGFMDAAERELARASRYARPFVLAYVDVRGLKAVNDTEGHLVGDELIKTVAGLMKESARADDVVGRIGGDEFALLLDEQTAEGAQPVLRRIRSRVEERRAAMEIRMPWELTIGIAAFPDDGTTLEELLGTADRRLYEQRGIALR